jgi:hypothetical protein
VKTVRSIRCDDIEGAKAQLHIEEDGDRLFIQPQVALGETWIAANCGLALRFTIQGERVFGMGL